MIYDLVIIGGGPAGMTAGIYAARYKLNTLIIAMDFGQISKAPCIENYPGIESLSGMDLVLKFKEQLGKLKVPIRNEEVAGIEKQEKEFLLTTKQGTQYQAKTVLFAMGASHRKLNVPDEDKFLGKGVSYCSTCDAPMFSGKNVAVVGGSNSAAVSAIHIAEFANEVTIIYRGEKLRAEPTLVNRITNKPNIKIKHNSNVTALNGEQMLSSVILDKDQELSVQGLFIEIGQVPSTDLAKELGAKLTERDYIEVDQAQMTNVPGVFAAGDITNASNNLKQILTAASQGAVAANAIFRYINQ